MKTPKELFKQAMSNANRYGWPHIIVAVDLHGVLVDTPKWDKAIEMGATVAQATEEAIYSMCLNPLVKMSLRKDIKLFLYTSTKLDIKQLVSEAFQKLYGIEFDYIQISDLGLETTRGSQDFAEKPYADVLFDNTSGFEPYVDWKDVDDIVNNYYITPKKDGDS